MVEKRPILLVLQSLFTSCYLLQARGPHNLGKKFDPVVILSAFAGRNIPIQNGISDWH